MLTVALTGGIGAGKSAALAMLEGLGAHVFRLDDIAHDVLAPGAPAVAAVARLWPDVVRNGSVDRAALGTLVFLDEGARAELEAIVHPATWASLDSSLAAHEASDPAGIAVFELALLVGSARQDRAHFNLAIEAGRETRLARLEGERAMSGDDARARMATQASPEAIAGICDAVLVNDGSLRELELALTELWEGRLLPYARNLAEGKRNSGEIGAALQAAQQAHAMRRARARLECHGVCSIAVEPARIELLSRPSKAAMRAAGFVPESGGYASADPAVHLHARLP